MVLKGIGLTSPGLTVQDNAAAAIVAVEIIVAIVVIYNSNSKSIRKSSG